MDICNAAMEELLVQSKQAAAEAGLSKVTLEQGEITLPALPQAPQRLIGAYAQALVDQGKKRKDLVVLDADLKLDCGLIPFEEQFPERFIECGIAEQDMVSQAGGLALSGMLPVVHSFACFMTPRANEQIFNNATEETRIIYVGSLAGLVPGGPGHSHQSVRDISILAAVPGLTLLEPCCEAEVAMVLDWAVHKNQGSTYIRLVSIPCEQTFQLPLGYSLTPGQGAVLRRGKDVLIFAYGPILVEQAWQAASLLDQKGITTTVIALPWLNSVDQEWLKELAQGHNLILTLDNHLTAGGQGQMLAKTQAVAVLKDKPRLVLKGVDSIPACGLNHEVLKHHGLDAEGISKTITQLLNNH